MRKCLNGVLCSAVLLSFLSGSRTFAQLTTAAVVGTVTDTSGAVVPNAKVTVVDVDTHVSRSAQSNTSGDFVFEFLPPGPYTLTAEMPGFSTLKQSLTLVAGERARADVSLQVGGTQQVVQVRGDAAALQTQSADVGDVVTEQAVQDLPMNGRNYITLVQTTPGVNAGPGGGVQTGARPDDRRQSSAISANGQSESFNNNLIDGMDNNEIEQGEILLRPSIDGIAEVRVTTSNYSAEVGRSGGAVINVITKSGTNAFHGTLYEYLRNDQLNANDYFSNQAGLPRPEYRQNQFGGSIGGPIIKDKTFFFGDIEAYRIVQGSPSGLLTVPTLYEKQNPGDFTDIGGDKIPAGQIDPVALQYFALYPDPNVAGAGTTNNFSANPRYTQNSTTADIRVDQHFGEKDSMFVRYSYNPVTTVTPGAFPAVDGIQGGGTGNYPGTAKETGQGVQVNDVHIFSPQLVMEVRGGFTRLNILSRQLNYGTNASQKFGMPNVNVNSFNSGLTPVSINGYAPLGDTSYLPIADVNNVFQGNGTLTYTHGKHEIVTGGGLIRRQMNYYQAAYGEGQYTYNGSAPESLENFLRGVATTVNRQMPLYFNYMRLWEPSAFLQDNWRPTPWLTVNAGLRWDHFSPVTNAHNQRSNVNLQTGQIIVASDSDPAVGVQPDYKDFAPRIGFSASLRHGMVLRGGFGLSFFPQDDSGSATNLFNPPFQYTFSCVPGSTTQGLVCPAGVGSLSQGPPLPVEQSIAPDEVAGSLNILPAHNPAAYLEQFNLSLEKQFGQDLFTVAYIGQLGRKLSWNANIDVPLPSTNPNPVLPYAAQFPNVGSIYAFYPIGGSSYHAAQFSYEHRLSQGLNVRAAYTFASNLDNIFDPGTWISTIGQVLNNLRYDWGNSDNAVRHLFNMSASYALPFAKGTTGLKHTAFGGWQVNAIAFYMSGIPYTVMDNAFAPALINEPGVYSDRPNVVSGQSFTAPHRSISSYFNINAFTPQPFGSAGNEARNQLWGPNNRELDLSLFKDFPIREPWHLQFRAESYNVTNTENFGQPNSGIGQFTQTGRPDPTVAAFGQITNTRTGSIPREFQFALKLLF